MSIFRPQMVLGRATELKLETLLRMGIKALLLDVDNTLTTHNNPIPDGDVLVWLERMRRGGIIPVLVSNNNIKRVRPFAESMGLEYTANACKPLTLGFSATARRLGLFPRQFAVVGDQIFTDVLGGNLFGALTVFVYPMQPETGLFFRLKRKLEAGILRRAGKGD